MTFSPNSDVLERAVDEFTKKQKALPEGRHLSLLNLSRFLGDESGDALQLEVLASVQEAEDPEVAISVIRWTSILRPKALAVVRELIPSLLDSHPNEVIEALGLIAGSDLVKLWSKKCWSGLTRDMDTTSTPATAAGRIVVKLAEADRNVAWRGVAIYLAEEEPVAALACASLLGGPLVESELTEAIQPLIDGGISGDSWEAWADLFSRALDSGAKHTLSDDLCTNLAIRLIPGLDTGDIEVGGGRKMSDWFLSIGPTLGQDSLAELKWPGGSWWAPPISVERRQAALSLQERLLKQQKNLLPALNYEGAAIRQALASPTALTDAAQRLLLEMVENLTGWASSRDAVIKSEWAEARANECLQRLSGPRAARAAVKLHSYLKSRNARHRLPQPLLDLMEREVGEDVERALAEWLVAFNPPASRATSTLAAAQAHVAGSAIVKDAFEEYVSGKNRRQVTQLVSLMIVTGSANVIPLLTRVHPGSFTQTEIAKQLVERLNAAGNSRERRSALALVQDVPLSSPGSIKAVLDAIFSLAQQSTAAEFDVASNFPARYAEAPGAAARLRRISRRTPAQRVRRRIDSFLSEWW